MTATDNTPVEAFGPLHRPKGRSLKTLALLVPFVVPHRAYVGAALVFLAFAAAASLYVPIAVKEMIDRGFSKENAAAIDQTFLLLIGVSVVLGLATGARFYCVTWLGERVVADIRKAVYGHVLSLSPAFFEITRTGEILSRLTTDTTLIQTAVGSSFSIALRNLVMLMGGLVMMLVTSAHLTGMVLIAAPLVVLPLILLGRRIRTLSRRAQDRVADTAAYASETLSAIQTVQAFTHEAIDRQRFSVAVESGFDAARRRVLVRAIMTVLAILLVFSSIVGVLWAGAQAVLDGQMSAGELGQFILYAVLVAGSFGALSEVWGEINQAAGAAERLMELKAIMPEVQAPPEPESFARPMRGAIAFEGVSFEYPQRPGIAALDGFDLKVEAGERVALVGPSGAGKSTVFQLLLRFFDPQSGRILIDGVDIRLADPADVRGAIALVSQETMIFGTSALENIRYGRPDASEAEVAAAALAAQADAFIRELPQGYQTQLGERGVMLSGGQRQRIAIARALLRDAPILLLDEATSALDAESERLVQAGLNRLMQGRTTLIVAHRLATVQSADRIIVLDRGQVAGEGTHQELIARGGLYAHLAELQFMGLAAQ